MIGKEATTKLPQLRFMLSINAYGASLQSDIDASFNRFEKCRKITRLICTARSLRQIYTKA